MYAVDMFPTVQGMHVKAVINIIHVLQWKSITILYEKKYATYGMYALHSYYSTSALPLSMGSSQWG